MKLNKESIRTFREYTKEKLESLVIVDNQRIKFDKELLETLIFDTYKTDNGKIVKVPVWTGQFLSKIDLSEVSFDNVSWDDSIVSDHFENRDRNYAIDFSNTNAKIDFSKAHWKMHTPKNLNNCNFMGVDLSSSKIAIIDSFYNCNFSYTNIKIRSRDLIKKFRACDLVGINLSDVTLNYNYDIFNLLRECNIRDTGLKINFDKRDLSCYITQLKSAMSLDKLIGCYINGAKALSSGEQEKIKNEKIAEYVQLKEKTKKYIKDVVDEYNINGGQTNKKE